MDRSNLKATMKRTMTNASTIDHFPKKSSHSRAVCRPWTLSTLVGASQQRSIVSSLT